MVVRVSLVCVLLCGPLGLLAQESVAETHISVVGQVYDSVGNRPLTDALVQLVRTTALQKAQSSVTDSRGRYRIDSVVPGDYDDDGKTDFAVARDDNGVIRWDFEPSGTAGITTVTDTWGVTATDVIAQADHDGDGRTEYVVWRPGNPGVFYIMTPVTRRMWQQNWGLTGDLPTGNYNEH